MENNSIVLAYAFVLVFVKACHYPHSSYLNSASSLLNEMTLDNFTPLTLLGILLIIVGIVLVALPLIAKHLPNLEDVPWIIVWVYRTDGFVFATSPILIIISIISLIIHFATRMKAL